jgi:hypothetical protein
MPREIQLDLYQQFADAEAREAAKVQAAEQPEETVASRTIKEIKDRISDEILNEKKEKQRKIVRTSLESIRAQIDLEKKAEEEALAAAKMEKDKIINKEIFDIEPLSPAEEYYGRWADNKNRATKVPEPRSGIKNKFKYYAK